jgi:hypothetical protein
MADRHVGAYYISNLSKPRRTECYPQPVAICLYQRGYGVDWVLYGWSFFAVIQTGTIAAVGVAFAKFTAFVSSRER